MRGKESFRIEEGDDCYIIITQIANNVTDFDINNTNLKTRYQRMEIPKQYVENMRQIIKKDFSIDCNPFMYAQIRKKIIEFYHLDVSPEAYAGSINRAKIYFKYHYYPLKILEYLGEIHYNARGTVMPIDKKIDLLPEEIEKKRNKELLETMSLKLNGGVHKKHRDHTFF